MLPTAFRNRILGATMLTAAALLAGCESKEQKAIKFAESGAAYLAEGDIDSAKIQFNNALFENGENLQALRGAAEIAEQQEAYQRQVRMLRRLLELVPDDVPANNDFARLTLLGGETELAIKHANTVLTAEPTNIDALTVLGAALVIEGKSEEAADTLQRALDADPNNPEIFNLIAAQSIKAQDFEEAFRVLEEGIGQVENPETLLVVKLVLADQQLTPDDVIETFKALIEVAPANGVYKQKLGEYLLIRKQDFTQSRQLLADSVPLLEQPLQSITRIVAIDRQTRGDAVAEQTLQNYINQYPENEDLAFSRPNFFCQVDEIEKCDQAFSELLEREPEMNDRRVRAINGRGNVAIVQRRFDDARSLSDEVLDFDPANVAALITRGQVQLAQGGVEESIQSFRTALDGAPKNAEALVFLALAYEQNKQINFADAQFALAVDEVGYVRPVIDQYRAFLLRQGEIDRSMDLLDRYLRRNPSDGEALMQRAQGAVAQQDFLQAEAAAQALVTNSDGAFSSQAGAILAQSLFGQERYVDALPIAEQTLAENPNDQGTYILRASVLQNLGRADQVIAELQAKLDGGEAAAVDYALLGDLLNNQGNHTAARAVSVEGLAKHPTSEQLFVLAFLSEEQSGNKTGAIAVLQDGISKAGSTTQLRTLLSNEYIVQGRQQDALRVLKSMYDDGNLTPVTANNYASLLLETGNDNEKALEIARLLEGTDNAFFADTLAWAYYQNDQVQNAMRYIAIAAEGLPRNADVLYHKAMIDIAREAPAQAREALQKAKENHDSITQTPMSKIDEALNSL